MNSLQGHFLVAAPHQLDPNFAETVILVVAHAQRGALGVIVNRPQPRGGRPHGLPGNRIRRHGPRKPSISAGRSPVPSWPFTPARAGRRRRPAGRVLLGEQTDVSWPYSRTQPALQTLHRLRGLGSQGNWSTRRKSASGAHGSRHGGAGILARQGPLASASPQASVIQLQTMFHIKEIPADPTLN